MKWLNRLLGLDKEIPVFDQEAHNKLMANMDNMLKSYITAENLISDQARKTAAEIEESIKRIT